MGTKAKPGDKRLGKRPPRAVEDRPAHFFKPGQSGNPSGKTSGQKLMEYDSATRAARLRNRMLTSLENKLNDAEANGDAMAIEMIQTEILKLMNDAEDRAYGKPVQATENKHEVGLTIRLEGDAEDL